MQIPKNRSIKFNLADPQEKKMDDYLIHNVGNFSGYVKRLIMNDILVNENGSIEEFIVEQNEENQGTDLNEANLMNGFI